MFFVEKALNFRLITDQSTLGDLSWLLKRPRDPNTQID